MADCEFEGHAFPGDYEYPPGAEKTHRIEVDNPVLLPDGTLATIIAIEDGIAHCSIDKLTDGETELLMASARLEELKPMPKHPLEYFVEWIQEQGEEDDSND